MAVDDEEVRGPLWVDGQFTVRVRGPGPEPGRIVRLRRPFALIGRVPGADLRIDDPEVEARHALLLLDRRGVFGVDLLSKSGTRFAGAEAAASWLGAGDILEVAGRRIELLQLRVDGQAIDPPLCDDDPLGDAPGLVGLALEPLDAPGPPWKLGSALAFMGRGEACVIRVEDDSASEAHCALLRGPSDAHVIDLLGRRTLLNDRPVEGASALLDGDVLTVGSSRFAIRLGTATTHPEVMIPLHLDLTESAPSRMLARIDDASDEGPGRSTGIAHVDQGTMVAMLLEAAIAGRDGSNFEVLDTLRQFQADAATLFEAQIGRIEAMNREIASLRDEIRGHLGPPPIPAEPLRLDLDRPPVGQSGESAGWLLDRLNTLEAESRSTWKDVLGRIASTVGPRSSSQPRQSPDSTPRNQDR